MSETLQEITRVKQQLDSHKASLDELIKEARKEGNTFRAIGEAAGYHHENIRKIVNR